MVTEVISLEQLESTRKYIGYILPETKELIVDKGYGGFRDYSRNPRQDILTLLTDLIQKSPKKNMIKIFGYMGYETRSSKPEMTGSELQQRYQGFTIYQISYYLYDRSIQFANQILAYAYGTTEKWSDVKRVEDLTKYPQLCTSDECGKLACRNCTNPSCPNTACQFCFKNWRQGCEDPDHRFCCLGSKVFDCPHHPNKGVWVGFDEHSEKCGTAHAFAYFVDKRQGKKAHDQLSHVLENVSTEDVSMGEIYTPKEMKMFAKVTQDYDEMHWFVVSSGQYKNLILDCCNFHCPWYRGSPECTCPLTKEEQRKLRDTLGEEFCMEIGWKEDGVNDTDDSDSNDE